VSQKSNQPVGVIGRHLLAREMFHVEIIFFFSYEIFELPSRLPIKIVLSSGQVSSL
jgi:hypothetical protein